MFRTLKEIMGFLNKCKTSSSWLVQKYIERPLLYRQRKFDIRVWVLATCKHELFFYREGYMRTSSAGYDLKNQDKYVHLTNNCLQQYGGGYGEHEDGNTLSFETLKAYLQENYGQHDLDFERDVVAKMKDLVIDSYLSSKKSMNQNKRKNVFELFGYDFLLDEDLRTWLIEVNTNPYLGKPNSFIADLLPKMIDDMLEITIDGLFPPKTPARDDSRPNNFELIYCESRSNYSSMPINSRTPFTEGPYPIKSLIPLKDPLSSIAKLPPGYTGVKQQQASLPPEAIKHDDKARKHSTEGDKIVASPADQKYYAIEALMRNLHAHVHQRNLLDVEYINLQFARIVAYLISWQSLSNTSITLLCRAVLLLSSSVASVTLSEQRNVLSISKLLSDSSMKLEVRLVLVPLGDSSFDNGVYLGGSGEQRREGSQSEEAYHEQQAYPCSEQYCAGILQ